MSLVVPHAAGSAALASLDAALSTAAYTTQEAGKDLRIRLQSLVGSWNSSATAYNTQLASGTDATTLAALTRVVTAAESEAVRLSLSYTPTGTVFQRAAALKQVFGFQNYPFQNQSLSAALQSAQSSNVAPDDSAITALIAAVNDFASFARAG